MNDSAHLTPEKRMTVEEAVQNAKIKVSAFRAAQTTLERRKRDKDHFKVVFDKAQQDYNQAYAEVEAAREMASTAKHLLFEVIEKETF